MPVPSLSPEARKAAAVRAARLRTGRFEIRQRIKRGELALEHVLAVRLVDEMVGGMRVRQLVEALPAMGPIKAAALLERLGIAANKRVRGLGRQQETALLAWAKGR